MHARAVYIATMSQGDVTDIRDRAHAFKLHGIPPLVFTQNWSLRPGFWTGIIIVTGPLCSPSQIQTPHANDELVTVASTSHSKIPLVQKVPPLIALR